LYHLNMTLFREGNLEISIQVHAPFMYEVPNSQHSPEQTPV